MSKNYKTEGRQKLLKFMSTHLDAHYTADQICMELNGDLSRRSSIYRNISLLCDEGILRKFRCEGQSCFVYQYVGESGCSEHFHLKCIGCGKLMHLECEMGKDLKNHIFQSHGFDVDCGRSILYGVCLECERNENEDLKNFKKVTPDNNILQNIKFLAENEK